MAHRRLTPEDADLAGRFLWLAIGLGRRFARENRLDRAEMDSYLHEQVCLLAREYDPSKDVEPIRFFGWRIRRRLIDYLRHERRARQFRTAFSLGDHQPPAPDPDLRAVEDREQVESLLRLLPDEESRLLRRHYLDGESRADIARECGVSPQLICKRVKSSLIRLRDVAEASP
jgi:RNA polymerase sigma factor (sigma-70 family)